jgi:hypothetical protein
MLHEQLILLQSKVFCPKDNYQKRVAATLFVKVWAQSHECNYQIAPRLLTKEHIF